MQGCSPSRSGLSVVFEKLTVADSGRAAPNVLEDVSGVIRGGHLSAIMSVCGSRGDQYLLRALAGHVRLACGSIWANGVPSEADTYRRGAVLVAEEVTEFEDLTVRQNMYYSLRLRSLTDPTISVGTIEHLLKLEPYQNTLLRDCSLFTRRRALIARELVLQPFLICIDAAIQGLPLYEAQTLLRMLKSICALQGIALVISVVQPRWSLLSLVDDIFIIQGNRCVFQGGTQELIESIRQLPRPVFVDAYTTMASTEVSAAKNPIITSSPEVVLSNLYRLASAPGTSLLNFFSTRGRMPKIKKEVAYCLRKCAMGTVSLPYTSPAAPNSLFRLFYLFRATVDKINNNKISYIIFYLVLFCLALLLAAVYQSQDGQTGMQNRIGMSFFLISLAYLYNILLVDRQIRLYQSFLRFRQHGFYDTITYVMHWLLTCALARFFSSGLFALVVIGIASIQAEWDATSLIHLAGIVAVLSFGTAILVFFICTLVTKTRIAYFILLTKYAFDVIAAGIIINTNTLPFFFDIISHTSHIRLGYESAVLTQLINQTFGCLPGLPTTPHLPKPCYTGNQYIKFLGFRSSNKWTNIAELLIITGGLCIVSFAITIFKSPR